jgi:hypothetical protein
LQQDKDSRLADWGIKTIEKRLSQKLFCYNPNFIEENRVARAVHSSNSIAPIAHYSQSAQVIMRQRTPKVFSVIHQFV